MTCSMAAAAAAAVGRRRIRKGEIDDHAPFIFSVANRHLCQIAVMQTQSVRWSPSIRFKRHGTKWQRDRARGSNVEGRPESQRDAAPPPFGEDPHPI